MERRFVGARVDLEQQVALLDELVVDDRQLDDRAGDARRDLDHLGHHLAVPGPGVGHVVPVAPEDRGEQDHGDRGGHEGLGWDALACHDGITNVPIITV